MVRPLALAAAFATLCVTSPVLADDDYVPPVRHAATAKECGECHMAFQPALLPAGAWHKLMAGLDDHFGENAALPAETAADIEAYLVAGARRRGDPAVIRITEQRWWRHEHDFSPQRLARAGAAGPSDCLACHKGAEQGYYEDD